MRINAQLFLLFVDVSLQLGRSNPENRGFSRFLPTSAQKRIR